MHCTSVDAVVVAAATTMTHAAVEILNDDALPLWKSCKLLHHDDTLTLVGYTNYDTRDFYWNPNQYNFSTGITQ